MAGIGGAQVMGLIAVSHHPFLLIDVRLSSTYLLSVQKWVMFDDAHVGHVGDWLEVIRKCTAGKIQPLVLFYQLDRSPAK